MGGRVAKGAGTEGAIMGSGGLHWEGGRQRARRDEEEGRGDDGPRTWMVVGGRMEVVVVAE